MLPLETSVAEVDRLRRTGADLLLLDCREGEEVAIATIDGSTWIPMGQIVERVGELSAYKDQPLVVYCHLGGRSLRVANWLRQQGFDQAQSMAGGIDAWAEEVAPGMGRY